MVLLPVGSASIGDYMSRALDLALFASRMQMSMSLHPNAYRQFALVPSITGLLFRLRSSTMVLTALMQEVLLTVLVAGSILSLMAPPVTGAEGAKAPGGTNGSSISHATLLFGQFEWSRQ